jgi:hypothetical protein
VLKCGKRKIWLDPNEVNEKHLNVCCWHQPALQQRHRLSHKQAK